MTMHIQGLTLRAGLLAAATASSGLAEEEAPDAEGSTAQLPSQVEPLPSGSDGVYGRFDGNIHAGLGAGAGMFGKRPVVGLQLSGDYYSTLSLLARWTINPKREESPPTRQTLTASAGLRPLFLLRWSEGLEVGPAWFDLALDSVRVGVDVTWALAETSKTGVGPSLGVSCPLSGQAQGLWLDLQGSHLWAPSSTVDGAPWPHGREWVFFGALSYHWMATLP